MSSVRTLSKRVHEQILQLSQKRGNKKASTSQPSKWHRSHGWAAAENRFSGPCMPITPKRKCGAELDFSNEQAQKLSRFPLVRDLDPILRSSSSRQATATRRRADGDRRGSSLAGPAYVFG